MQATSEPALSTSRLCSMEAPLQPPTPSLTLIFDIETSSDVITIMRHSGFTSPRTSQMNVEVLS
ncbi:hypothetical protein AZE42_06199 [Rhizopogon vesiculosus]|uniref:Uncharacterized protein n=1 Tax=Rhizopogon vesiculosus TaxID=180088 RepID=A0A1J8Q8B5_9AGAM|nr:hypothetical protein AZE42_06199 [Rhizopogon vesiculosus]